MARELFRTVAPITQGVRDVANLLPAPDSAALSDEVADLVAAQDELQRQREESTSLARRASLNTLIGAALGGTLGAVKAYPFTRQFGNPAVVGTAAGIGGASALAFTLARHALRKTLARRAQQRVSAASPAAQLVTSHPETVDKAREWASAQWSPYLGLELGALVGAVGPAAFTAAQPDSSHGSTALRAGIGAGIGGLAGLGIGYLYRKRKQREFLEHVEREMTDMNSPKAQEAVTQAAVEKDNAPLNKVAEDGLRSGALLYTWLASRKDPKKQKEQDHVDTTDYDLGRLEKAATTMVKDAVDGLARRPFVATNAPLMRGMGGPPDRFGSTALGARRLKKWAEDDPNALGEEVDDVVLAAVRASEEQHGPRKRIEVSNDDVKPAECGPSQQKIGESSTQLPYRKRVEVVAIKDGKIYGGVYKDGGFGFFGGGVDDDNLEDAAVREFAEETGLSIKNPKQLDVSPVSEDWRPPYSSEKMRERAKNYRGSTTYFVVADLDDSSPTSKATGDDGRSSIKQPRLYDMNEVQKLLSVDVPEQYVPITEGRRAAVNAVRTLGQQKVADVAQLLPRKEVLYFTPTGKLAVRPSTGRRIDLPTDIEGKPVPYEQPVTVLPEGGVPEKGVHGYQVSLQSAEGDLPEGFEEVDPQEALKNLYAAMGKPENRQYQALDRARARALLRIIKKRLPA